MKRQSLKKRSDFLRVGKQGHRVSQPCFILRMLSRTTPHGHHNQHMPSGPCVGFTVTKRLDKRATQRNRIKRRLRALVDLSLQHASHLWHPQGDYVLIARNSACHTPFIDMQNELTQALQYLHRKTKLSTSKNL